ncbi:MAG: rRNA maturation RNase YbeY [Saprospiraceae bacterium]|nr:rRNA maturation RNase YbeY [Saprospiraceae bacterium]
MEDAFSQDFESDAIEFHTEDCEFSLENEDLVIKWVKEILQQENKILQHISFIFCSDSYLHELNVQYLHHDTLTDIITFYYAYLPDIEGDIFISIDRIKENAKIFAGSFEEELHRVIAHGVLHLCGYGDKSDSEKVNMIIKENEALRRLSLLKSEKK